MAKAALERFDHDARVSRRDRLHLDNPGLQKFVDRSLHGYHLRLLIAIIADHGAAARPLGRYLEYNSTTRLSLISGRISCRSGTDLRMPDIFLSSTSTQSGNP